MTDTVLFVDDEPGITQSIKRALRREPYDIVCANSAQEALELFKEQRFSIVVSDDKMPKMSGSELLGIIRREYPDTIRLLFTGYATLEAATRALNAGEVFRFLKKPCNEIDLAIALRQALQYRRLLLGCHNLLSAVRVFRSYLGTVAPELSGGEERIKEMLEEAIKSEPFSLNIQQLIDELEWELKGLSAAGSKAETKSEEATTLASES